MSRAPTSPSTGRRLLAGAIVRRVDGVARASKRPLGLPPPTHSGLSWTGADVAAARRRRRRIRSRGRCAAAGIALLMAGACWGQTTGASIVERGSPSGAPPCRSCHGADLEGTRALHAPALAGLPAAFVLERLAHYAGPDGHNAEMRAVAQALSPSERQIVAAYLSSLKPSSPPPHVGGLANADRSDR